MISDSWLWTSCKNWLMAKSIANLPLEEYLPFARQSTSKHICLVRLESVREVDCVYGQQMKFYRSISCSIWAQPKTHALQYAGSSTVRRNLKVDEAVKKAFDSETDYSIFEPVDKDKAGEWAKAVDSKKTFASQNICSGDTLIVHEHAQPPVKVGSPSFAKMTLLCHRLN